MSYKRLGIDIPSKDVVQLVCY